MFDSGQSIHQQLKEISNLQSNVKSEDEIFVLNRRQDDDMTRIPLALGKA